MNKKNLEILGLSEAATIDDVNAAYETLRAKYLEERFMDGEAGNNAAKMLTKIETAYTELTREFSEGSSSGDGDALARVEELIKNGNIQDAQRELDTFNERGAEWHYLQSIVFYRKNWINESKKQLEIAMQLDGENEKYKEAYRKLNDRINYNAQATPNDGQGGYQNGAYNGQTMNGAAQDDQMGGSFCSQCLECCYTYMCISCLCDGCCR